MKLEIPKNLVNKKTWQRILYTLLFSIAFSLAKTILTAIVIIQLIIVLFTGNTQDTLKGFSQQLSRYLYQITQYVSFNSEKQPFPFGDWPKTAAPEDVNFS
jgi:hypothetical protein